MDQMSFPTPNRQCHSSEWNATETVKKNYSSMLASNSSCTMLH